MSENKILNLTNSTIVLMAILVFANSASADCKKDYDKAIKEGSVAAYRTFLGKCQTSQWTAQVRLKLEDLEWLLAENADKLPSYEEYVRAYPSGRFLRNATARIDVLRVEADLRPGFMSQLAQATSIAEMEALVQANSQYEFASEAIPMVEAKIIDEIKAKGPGDRLVMTNPAAPGPANRVTIRGFVDTFSAFQEFPGDELTIPMNLGVGSVIRYAGSLKVGGEVIHGEGDRLNRLTFAMIDGVGYVYLRGKGRLVGSDGREVKFGN